MTRSARKYSRIAIILCITIASILWWTSPPCAVITTAYLGTSHHSLPDSGATIRSLSVLHRVVQRYGLIDCPDWMHLAKFGEDELIVIYPHFEIIRTASLQDSLFLVKIRKSGKKGIGVALLRGNINVAPMFNEE